MAEFKKGQLVAVRNSDEFGWKMFVYDHEEDGRHFCTWPEYEDWGATDWKYVRPAEEVWPNIFLSVEREIAETLREQRDQHYRQLHWLCERLQTLGECPPDGRFRNCRLGCPKCWEMALQEAVEEEQC